MPYEFSPARREEAEQIFAVIRERIRWMDEIGVDQWNSLDYWEIFPEAYYIRAIDRGELYVVRDTDSGAVACLGVLSGFDKDWKDGVPAVYLHNFAAALDARGAGDYFLEQGEAYARANGKTAFRLDCIESNPALNDYYERRGYRAVGRVAYGDYRGIQREKRLQNQE